MTNDLKGLLRTPDERFRNLPGYPFAPRYADVEGARMHYAEQGRGQVVLCLHGEGTWSYLYRKTIAELSWKYRVIAPDLIGFGRSDKYEDTAAYSLRRHAEQLAELVRRLDLIETTLVCHDWAALVGLALLARETSRFLRLVFLSPRMETEVPERDPLAAVSEMQAGVREAYEAPFPDPRFETGARSFRRVLSAEAAELERARKALSDWFKPALVLVSDDDAIAESFSRLVPSGGRPVMVHGGGRLLAELRGEEVADRIHSFILRNPPASPTRTFQPVPFW
jgi:haloalkane dehalogenase